MQAKSDHTEQAPCFESKPKASSKRAESADFQTAQHDRHSPIDFLRACRCSRHCDSAALGIGSIAPPSSGLVRHLGIRNSFHKYKKKSEQRTRDLIIES